MSKHRERYWVHSEPEPDLPPIVKVPAQRTGKFCVGYRLDRQEGVLVAIPCGSETRTGYLCSTCRNRLSSLLIRIPSLSVWLYDNIEPSGAAGERVSGSREEPIPLRIDILDYIGPTAAKELSETMGTTYRELNSRGLPERVQIGEPSLLDVVGSWAMLVSEERNDDWPTKDDLSSLTSWLHSQLDWIVQQSWVDDMLWNLGDVARKAERVAPRSPEIRRIKKPCPSCDIKALVFTRGIGVKCEQKLAGCGRSWIDDEFDRLVIVLGSEALGETA